MKKIIRKLSFLALAMAICLSINTIPAFASSNNSKSATFELKSKEIQEKEINLPNGEKGIIGIEPVTNLFERASNGSHKIYYYSGVGNATFYINVSNNRITRAYDPWHLIIGASVKSASLKLDNSKQATYNFSFGTPIWDFGGWNGWVRANINYKNQIVVTIK